MSEASSVWDDSDATDCILQHLQSPDAGDMLQHQHAEVTGVTVSVQRCKSQISVSNLSMRHWSMLLRNLIGLNSPTDILSALSRRLSGSLSSAWV